MMQEEGHNAVRTRETGGEMNCRTKHWNNGHLVINSGLASPTMRKLSVAGEAVFHRIGPPPLLG